MQILRNQMFRNMQLYVLQMCMCAVAGGKMRKSQRFASYDEKQNE